MLDYADYKISFYKGDEEVHWLVARGTEIDVIQKAIFSIKVDFDCIKVEDVSDLMKQLFPIG